jgi:hypothetical protein
MNFYRISVGASSLSMWCNEETAVLCSARITARLTGQSALVVQVLPEYRVVATIQPDDETVKEIPVGGPGSG